MSLTSKTSSCIKNLNEGDSRCFRKDKEEKNISHPTNVAIVTRWDILRNIVQLDENNKRRKSRGTMPMQLKMKSHAQR
jgi:hypothetical protein